MAVILQYKAFVAGLAGYREVTFDLFRGKILPLKAKKAWTQEDTQLVQQLADEGCAFSLQQLLGAAHPAGQLVLGNEALKQMENVNELHHRMNAFKESTERRGASPLWYLGALATLRSSDYKLDLSASDALFPGIATFAHEYRGGSKLYKQVVDRHFAIMACSATKCEITGVVRAPYVNDEWFRTLFKMLDVALRNDDLKYIDEDDDIKGDSECEWYQSYLTQLKTNKIASYLEITSRYPWFREFVKLAARSDAQFVTTLRDTLEQVNTMIKTAVENRDARERMEKSLVDETSAPIPSSATQSAPATKQLTDAKKKRNAKKRAQAKLAARGLLPASIEAEPEAEPEPEWISRIRDYLTEPSPAS